MLSQSAERHAIIHWHGPVAMPQPGMNPWRTTVGETGGSCSCTRRRRPDTLSTRRLHLESPRLHHTNVAGSNTGGWEHQQHQVLRGTWCYCLTCGGVHRQIARIRKQRIFKARKLYSGHQTTHTAWLHRWIHVWASSMSSSENIVSSTGTTSQANDVAPES